MELGFFRESWKDRTFLEKPSRPFRLTFFIVLISANPVHGPDVLEGKRNRERVRMKKTERKEKALCTLPGSA